jgi:hypothetical protein
MATKWDKTIPFLLVHYFPSILIFHLSSRIADRTSSLPRPAFKGSAARWCSFYYYYRLLIDTHPVRRSVLKISITA